MNVLDVFHGPNAGYVLELYERYKDNPQTVDPTMRALFERWSPDGATTNGAATNGTATNSIAASSVAVPAPATTVTNGASDAPLDVAHIVGAARLIRYIREVGHKAAQIDPLGSPPPGDPGLNVDVHGISEEDLARLPASIVRGPLVAGSANALEAVNKLRQVYVGTIGVETDHIHVFEERSWIRENLEAGTFFQNIDAGTKRNLLERLTETAEFEQFLHKTFVGQKRFSLEGCDVLVPMLGSIIRNAAVNDTREVVIGMAHRGRLNVLAHTLGKPYEAILGEFQAANRAEGTASAGSGHIGWIGDVKYHLGAQRRFQESGIGELPLTLAPNPSHLEFVNPVVEGRARAAQEQLNQPGAPVQDERASLAILIHGDAAFPGQGIVAETLNLSQLNGYCTGGTIHIITNNQVGFTTNPGDSRSTLYASDLAKGFEIPIVHVNADDPLACLAMARLALAYREKFGKDFVIDLVGYRRWGHNEGDEPAFTQPLMYQTIVNHPTARAVWAQRLEQEGVIAPGEADALVAKVQAKLQAAWEQVKGQPGGHGHERPTQTAASIPAETAVPEARLRTINDELLKRPDGFAPNQRLERTLQRRQTAMDQEHAIDWGHAEALAFATILEDGTPIRLTGQDSERGTFSHRHAVLTDANTGARYTPHQVLPQARASFAVYNSPLSENAALGFEYGYSSHAPNALVLWEAQFGDFANGAQVIIDQFLVSGRSKWGQTPALVLLLPHGYEGQGPEHSSARLERFLQLAAEGNIRVANCTTAAQYFHLLRRQVALLEREPRPLILMTPKSLLRHPRAASSLSELTSGTFQPVMSDPVPRERIPNITRLILCSGKVYVDLVGAPDTAAADDIAIARVEQLARFPEENVRDVIAQYPALEEVVWLQEEPQNMGAWSYVLPRIQPLLPPNVKLIYVGRAAAASPAEGSLANHTVEQARIVKDALGTRSRTPVPLAVSGQSDG